MGIVVLFYSNEHEPVHVHGKCRGRESRAELMLREGRVVDIIYTLVRDRQPLAGVSFRTFKRSSSITQMKSFRNGSITSCSTTVCRRRC